ncbi:hypothetical protein [Roseobacter sp. S98]|uniref:hypothetical protein n=1 Tax=Roseobacter algicola (ex Choi et al. 2025) (nom. illeg.) TaxID=3092138 RepID=UPI00389394A6
MKVDPVQTLRAAAQICVVIAVLAVGHAAHAIGTYRFECAIVEAKSACPFNKAGKIKFEIGDIVRNSSCREISLAEAGIFGGSTKACVASVGGQVTPKRADVPDGTGLLLASDSVWEFGSNDRAVNGEPPNGWFWNAEQSYEEPAACSLICYQSKDAH